MYIIKQTQTEKYFFNLLEREIVKEYKFATYIEAVKFALFEQIKYIYFSKGSAQTKTNVFKYFYSLESFKYNAKKNPLHYCGVRNIERINIKQYYNVLIERNINKLKTF